MRGCSATPTVPPPPVAMNATTIVQAPTKRSISVFVLLRRHVQARFRCTRVPIIGEGYPGVIVRLQICRPLSEKRNPRRSETLTFLG